MKLFSVRPPLVFFGAAAVLAWFGAGRAETQNPELKPTYGSVKLKAGFTPDPHKVKVTAGIASDGAIQTKLGGVKAWVANAPDFKLHYTAGQESLTIYVQSKGDATLLINTPDGKWVADDDGGKGLGPKIRFAKPKSGRYDIWVGTYKKKNERGTLYITELK